MGATGFFILFCCPFLINLFIILPTKCFCDISAKERMELREEARDMFYHAYFAYMENAFPADELMPLSCKGRYRGLTPNRGDIDDCLGNFSLTLIDTLDTLVVLGDFEEFEHGVKLVLSNVKFDNDVVVSVFETNIRVLGGLLSAHILAEYVQEETDVLQWYKGELLTLAKDLGYRLLPAFNTSTGIPYSRINLKNGVKSERVETVSRETCTACAGSMILEMAALSRLTGEFVFEEKAQRAMDELWKMRHRSSDLMGAVLNVHSGDWVRRDSGVGAGIDSYYEYCLKAYILLGDEKYLNRFNRHYEAIMKYISQGPMLLDVHMHRPYTNSRNFMDALLAFWPGLQVLKGDLKSAVETHEMLYQVTQRHKFIPEAFTTDFQVHWSNHPLRPEFLESTYFLYKATNDPYYLEVGKSVLKSLQKYARVPCGYAAVSDVRTGRKEDRMDSFVLAETFKYLFLLFANDDDLLIDLNEFLFTTEGHLLPLTLAVNGNKTKNYSSFDDEFDDREFSRTCPNTLQLFPETVRKKLENMVDGVCPKRTQKRRLTASEFSAANLQHLKMIKDMGINMVALSDGRIQLLHSLAGARSLLDAEEGILFMQEMVEFSKSQASVIDASPQQVSFFLKGKDDDNKERKITLQGGPAQFGRSMRDDDKIEAETAIISPFRSCADILRPDTVAGKIAIVERGDCMFVEKARRLQKAGAVAGIVVDNVIGSSASTSPLFSMSGDGNDDINIPFVFLFSQDASKLLLALATDPKTVVTIKEFKGTKTEANIGDDDDDDDDNKNNNEEEEEESMFQKLKGSVQEFLNKHAGITFTKSVKVGRFKADIGTDKIRIVKDDSINDVNDSTTLENNKKEEEKQVQVQEQEQWMQMKLGLIKSLNDSKNKEIFVPINLLQIYYQSLTKSSSNKKDVVIETEWLLRELDKEFGKKYNSNKEIKNNMKEDEMSISENNLKKLDSLNSMLDAVSEIEKDVIGNIEEQDESDDLVIGKKKESSQFIDERIDKIKSKTKEEL